MATKGKPLTEDEAKLANEIAGIIFTSYGYPENLMGLVDVKQHGLKRDVAKQIITSIQPQMEQARKEERDSSLLDLKALQVSVVATTDLIKEKRKALKKKAPGGR